MYIKNTFYFTGCWHAGDKSVHLVTDILLFCFEKHPFLEYRLSQKQLTVDNTLNNSHYYLFSVGNIQ